MTDEQNEQNKQNEKLEFDQQNPYDSLDETGRNIVDLKLEGWKYKRIEPVAKVKEGTLRQWFMTGGKYYDAYQWRKRQIIKEALEDFDEAEFHLKQGVADAVVVLKNEVAKKNWRASVALLKMVGFDVHRILTDEESEGTKLLKELITMRRNEKHKSRKPIFDRKSKNKTVSKSEKNL